MDRTAAAGWLAVIALAQGGCVASIVQDRIEGAMDEIWHQRQLDRRVVRDEPPEPRDPSGRARFRVHSWSSSSRANTREGRGVAEARSYHAP